MRRDGTSLLGRVPYFRMLITLKIDISGSFLLVLNQGDFFTFRSPTRLLPYSLSGEANAQCMQRPTMRLVSLMTESFCNATQIG